jgi:hypothetical protein
MSKKTKAEKHQRRMMKPKRHRRTRRMRPNPAYLQPPMLIDSAGKPLGLFADPLFMHHLAGALIRALDLYPPKGIEPSGKVGDDMPDLGTDLTGKVQ